jgi:hypothetical protein
MRNRNASKHLDLDKHKLNTPLPSLFAAMAAKEDLPVDRIDVPRLVERLDAKSRYPIDESFVKPE